MAEIFNASIYIYYQDPHTKKPLHKRPDEKNEEFNLVFDFEILTDIIRNTIPQITHSIDVTNSGDMALLAANCICRYFASPEKISTNHDILGAILIIASLIEEISNHEEIKNYDIPLFEKISESKTKITNFFNGKNKGNITKRKTLSEKIKKELAACANDSLINLQKPYNQPNIIKK